MTTTDRPSPSLNPHSRIQCLAVAQLWWNPSVMKEWTSLRGMLMEEGGGVWERENRGWEIERESESVGLYERESKRKKLLFCMLGRGKWCAPLNPDAGWLHHGSLESHSWQACFLCGLLIPRSADFLFLKIKTGDASSSPPPFFFLVCFLGEDESPGFRSLVATAEIYPPTPPPIFSEESVL